jgi:hypothetical protein
MDTVSELLIRQLLMTHLLDPMQYVRSTLEMEVGELLGSCYLLTWQGQREHKTHRATTDKGGLREQR